MDGPCKYGPPALSNFLAEATAPALRTDRNALELPRQHHDAPDDRTGQGLPVRPVGPPPAPSTLLPSDPILREIPSAGLYVVAHDVGGAVGTKALEIAMVRCQPAVQHFDNLDRRFPY